jgi:hypothetical protein
LEKGLLGIIFDRFTTESFVSAMPTTPSLERQLVKPVPSLVEVWSPEKKHLS